MKLSDAITFRKNNNKEVVVVADNDCCMALFMYYVVMIGLGIADNELKEYEDAEDAIYKVCIPSNINEFDEGKDYGYAFDNNKS